MRNLLNGFLGHSTYFVIVLTIAYYALGIELKKRWKLAIFTPVIVASVLTIATIVFLGIDMEVYEPASGYTTFLMNAATLCYGMLLYEELEILKHNFKAIMIGIVTGVLVTMTMVLGLSLLFRLPYEQYVTLLPKNVTTAIGLSISEINGGYPAISVVWIILTGNIGNAIAEPVIKVFHIDEPVARGVAIGNSSHAIGTAKALEIGQVEGAISGLSLAVTGIISVMLAALYVRLY